jgi:hypothetical protein
MEAWSNYYQTQANHQRHIHVEVTKLVGKTKYYPKPDLLIQEMHLQKINLHIDVHVT